MKLFLLLFLYQPRLVSYDHNGNLLTDNLNSYTWDPNWGNMLTVSTGSTTVTNTYDALGRMVENNAGGAYTEFIYGPTGAKLATVNGTTLIKAFIPLPGGARAIYNPTGLAYYRHSDWLGSSRLTSTASRGLYSSTACAPFGEPYATAGSADTSFTGQDQSTVSSLYDFPARRDSPSQGRWISPDPSGGAAVILSDPASWNRYSYVRGHPLGSIDPVGTCDLIVAGSGEDPNSLAGQAIQNYADSIGADVVFPYAGLSNEQSVEDIINQGEGYTTPAAQLTATALSLAANDGAANGTGLGATTFSGGAQALNSAIGLTGITPDNINYLSPGMGGIGVIPIYGAVSTNFYRGAGAVEWLLGITTRADERANRLYNADTGGLCGHSGACAFNPINSDYFPSTGACSDQFVLTQNGYMNSGNGGWYVTDPLGAWMDAVVNAAIGDPGVPVTTSPSGNRAQVRVR